MEKHLIQNRYYPFRGYLSSMPLGSLLSLMSLNWLKYYHNISQTSSFIVAVVISWLYNQDSRGHISKKPQIWKCDLTIPKMHVNISKFLPWRTHCNLVIKMISPVLHNWFNRSSHYYSKDFPALYKTLEYAAYGKHVEKFRKVLMLQGMDFTKPLVCCGVM